MKILTARRWGGGRSRYGVELRVTDLFYVFVRASSVEEAKKKVEEMLEKRETPADQEHRERIVDVGSAWNQGLEDEAADETVH